MRETAQILREKGLKVTPQRIAIYTMLLGTKAHPSAETIYKALEPSNPTMSLATVYKTLDSFQQANLVQELNVGETCSRYDAEVESHPHIVCTTCGQVFDLELSGLDNLKQKVLEQTDFKVEREQLFFYGECPECQLKSKKTG